MTVISEATSATSARSWDTKIMAKPSCFWRSFRSLMTCFWTVTSSAVVGSSQITSDGLRVSAMAMMTRWHWPPESSCG